MVSDGGSRDRGQLILIGAVAIAFILLGIVVVFNSVLYTQTIASSDTVESGADAQTTELELERGGSRLAQAINRNEETDSSGTLEDELLDDDSGAIWEFVDQYGRTKAATKPTIIDVDTSSGTVTGWGRLVEQETEGNFTAPDGDEEWYVFGNDSTPEPPARKLGEMTLTIDVDTVDDLEITLEDESDADNVIEFEEDAGNLSVDLDGASDAECEIEPRVDGNVTVDLVDGTAWAETVGEDCSQALDLTSGLDDRYRWLEFQSNGDTRGTYEVVVSGDDATNVSGTNHLAVWSFEFDYRYDTAEVSYTRTIQVDVYGGDS